MADTSILQICLQLHQKLRPLTSRDVLESRSLHDADQIFLRAGEASYVNQKLSKPWLIPRFCRFVCNCIKNLSPLTSRDVLEGRSLHDAEKIFLRAGEASYVNQKLSKPSDTRSQKYINGIRNQQNTHLDTNSTRTLGIYTKRLAQKISTMQHSKTLEMMKAS